MTFQVPEQFRVRTGVLGTDASYGNNGLFLVKLKQGQQVRCIAADGLGWEHVSVSRNDRAPTFDEMEQVRQLFWGADSTVLQYHVPRGDWVSVHPFCLHLWCPTGVEVPRPPSMMVGPPLTSEREGKMLAENDRAYLKTLRRR